MEPFRELLVKDTKSVWTACNQSDFNFWRQLIKNKVMNGFNNFVAGQKTSVLKDSPASLAGTPPFKC